MNLSGLDMLHGLLTIGEPMQLQVSIKMGRWNLGKHKINMQTIANEIGAQCCHYQSRIGTSWSGSLRYEYGKFLV